MKVAAQLTTSDSTRQLDYTENLKIWKYNISES